jgi:hypothetical protein
LYTIKPVQTTPRGSNFPLIPHFESVNVFTISHGLYLLQKAAIGAALQTRKQREV